MDVKQMDTNSLKAEMAAIQEQMRLWDSQGDQYDITTAVGFLAPPTCILGNAALWAAKCRLVSCLYSKHAA